MSKMFSPNEEAISEIIGVIYDAVMNPAHWQTFVQTINDKYPGIAPVFYLADRKKALIESMLVSTAWGEDFLNDYWAHFNELNPWTPHLTNIQPLLTPLSGDKIVDHAEYKRSAFHNEFLTHFGDWVGVCGTVVQRDSQSFSMLGLHCSEKMYCDSRSEIEQFLAIIGPHINRAFKISREFEHGKYLNNTVENMLESYKHPAFIVDSDHQVLKLNRLAEQLFSYQTFSLDRFRKLTISSSYELNKQFQEAISKATREETPMGSFMQIPRGTYPPIDGLPLIAGFLPFQSEPDTLRNLPFILGDDHSKAKALLILHDPMKQPFLSDKLLKQLFDLTPTEIRLAQILHSGKSLQDYAHIASVVETTARGQLKSIFSKTNTHRQPELIALLSRLTTK